MPAVASNSRGSSSASSSAAGHHNGQFGTVNALPTASASASSAATVGDARDNIDDRDDDDWFSDHNDSKGHANNNYDDGYTNVAGATTSESFSSARPMTNTPADSGLSAPSVSATVASDSDDIFSDLSDSDNESAAAAVAPAAKK